jgi:NAD(P)-dependent dehydrogenase (short-subunit alcohol dehydrogenase family)
VKAAPRSATVTTSPSLRLADRIALITGASRGIGAAVARRFAAEGAHVILVARTVGGLEEVDDQIQAAGGSATLVPLDLATAGDGIDQLGRSLFDRFGRLDVLVANAAILGTLTPLAHIDPAEWDRVIATNLTVNWRLVRALDPLLRASSSGRAIFVTSGAGRRPIPYWGGYAVSKAALDMMASLYAAETAGSALRVNLINPGPTRTRMRAQAFPGERPDSLPDPERHTEAFVCLAETACTMHGQWVAADEWLKADTRQ